MNRILPFLLVSVLIHGFILWSSFRYLPDRQDSKKERVLDIRMIHVPASEADSSEHETSVSSTLKADPKSLAKRHLKTKKIPSQKSIVLPESAHALMAQPTIANPQAHEKASEEKPPALTFDIFKLSPAVLSKSVKMPKEHTTEPSCPDAMLEELFSEIKAESNIETAKYDYNISKMRLEFEDRWTPDFAEVQINSMKKAAVKWAKQWQKNAKQYAKTGTLPGTRPDGKDDMPHLGKTGIGVLDTYNDMKESGMFTTTIRLILDLDFDGKGGWHVDIYQPSGHPMFDKEAVDEIESVLSSKTLKLPDEAVKTQWALEADFSVLPPLPVAGFSFDIGLKKFEWAYPLKKSISKRIRLLAVKKGAGP